VDPASSACFVTWGCAHAEADNWGDDVARSESRRAMHFNALRQFGYPSALGMRKRSPMERRSRKYPKGNVVSGVCWCATGNARTDDGACSVP
jgi:hypothetical protein